MIYTHSLPVIGRDLSPREDIQNMYAICTNRLSVWNNTTKSNIKLKKGPSFKEPLFEQVESYSNVFPFIRFVSFLYFLRFLIFAFSASLRR